MISSLPPSILTHLPTGAKHIWHDLNSVTAETDVQHLVLTQKWSLIDKPLSFVMLIVESLDLCRTCPGVPLERCGPFPISTQNEMPWSCSQRWRRKVQLDLLPGRKLILSVHHSWISNSIFPWLRHGDSGEDPDQSQQRSEANYCQDFRRSCTKGDRFSSVQLRYSEQ